MAGAITAWLSAPRYACRPHSVQHAVCVRVCMCLCVCMIRSYGNSTNLAQLAKQLPYMDFPIIAYAYATNSSTASVFSRWLEVGCAQGPTGVTGAYKPAFVGVTTKYNVSTESEPHAA